LKWNCCRFLDLSLSPKILQAKFSGSLLGGMVGDVIGAAVEAESPGYIRKTFKNLDEILALKSVPELLSGDWEVGRFTDDTQMTICVAEWLASDATLDGKKLLERFCRAYEPWRHYGPGVRLILESFPKARDRWMDLATAMFPQGSYGNGSAMRVAPIGLFLHNDLAGLIEAVRISSVVTHSHYLAIQGATVQAASVAIATRGKVDTAQFLGTLKIALSHFEERGEDTSVYRKVLAQIAEGISKNVPPQKMSPILGNGIKAQEAVPMAIYCFLANRDSFEKAVEAAIFLGGDTDTIASMTGSIAAAALGESSIPERWLRRVRETIYMPDKVRQIAFELYQKGKTRNFKGN
jgi:poly(ADP-ribose) glycohydrolase ARH3